MRYFLVLPLLCIGAVYSSQIFAASDCIWRTWPQVLDKALESAPEFTSMERKRELGRRKMEASSLRPLSKASAQYVAGPSLKVGEGEFSYEWTIEKGEKRAARTKVADSEINLASAEIEERKASLILEVALISERFQQIGHENEVLNETLSTYRSILKQYNNLPELSPEQDVSVSVFKLAHDDAKLKLGRLQMELEAYKSYLSQLTGCSQVEVPTELRKERKMWPKPNSNQSLHDSAIFKRIEAEKQVAKDTLDMETKLLASDYSIGPMARWYQEESSQKLGVGIAVSIPIVSNQSKFLRSTAQASYQVAEAEKDLELKNFSSSLEKWNKQYRSSIALLNEGFAETDVHGKHQRMEKSFMAGRISASLIIEAHRQMYEHMISRHEVEAKATEALWNIRLLTGTLKKDDL